MLQKIVTSRVELRVNLVTNFVQGQVLDGKVSRNGGAVMPPVRPPSTRVR